MNGPAILGVILASPPKTDGARTLRQLDVVKDILGLDGLLIANLFSEPTQSVREISELGALERPWHAARPKIRDVLHKSGAVLVAYGTSEPVGLARSFHRQQVQWLETELIQAAHPQIWQVGEEPRHPSRWHQFVSDKYGRTDGGAAAERISQVLRQWPTTSMRRN